MLTKLASTSGLKLKSTQVPKVNVGKTVTTTTIRRSFSSTNKVNRNFGVFANFSKTNSKTSLIQPVKIFSAPRFQFSTEEEEEYTPKTYTRRPQRSLDTNLLLLRSQKEINEYQVKTLFGPNELKEIQVLKDPNGKFLGATFVTFASNDDAGKAMSFFRRVPREGEDAMIAVRPAQTSERDLTFQQSVSPSKVVVVKRLPYSASEDEIAKLFGGLNFQAVTVGNGMAVVKFATPQDAQNALAKNGTEFARRSLVVDTGLDIDFDYHASRPIKVLRIRGAPSSAREQEFREFFAPAEVIKVDFTYRDGISGRQVPGDVFVEFQSNEHLQQALKKDRQNLGERYLQLFRSSARERRNRLTSQFPRNNSFGQEGGQAEF